MRLKNIFLMVAVFSVGFVASAEAKKIRDGMILTLDQSLENLEANLNDTGLLPEDRTTYFKTKGDSFSQCSLTIKDVPSRKKPKFKAGKVKLKFLSKSTSSESNANFKIALLNPETEEVRGILGCYQFKVGSYGSMPEWFFKTPKSIEVHELSNSIGLREELEELKTHEIRYQPEIRSEGSSAAI